MAVTSSVPGLNSATWADVTGATTTITLSSTVKVAAWASVYWSGASNITAEFRLVIDSQNGDATTVTGRMTGGGQTAAITFTSTALAAGTYTVKLQYQKDSGTGDISVDHVDLTAIGMQAPIGATGPTGATGATGASYLETGTATLSGGVASVGTGGSAGSYYSIVCTSFGTNNTGQLRVIPGASSLDIESTNGSDDSTVRWYRYT